MCIGLPMQVIEPGTDRARMASGDREETVDTRLVGACALGEWLLVFQGAARERLDAARAAEIRAVLALVESALSGRPPPPDADPGFVLPSTLSGADLRLLAGPGAASSPP